MCGTGLVDSCKTAGLHSNWTMREDQSQIKYYIIINPRRACAARVTVVVLSFCLSVCLSVCYHVFCRATRRPISDTNGFSATLALFLKIAVFVKMLRWRVMA